MALSKNKIKEINALKIKKHRQEQKLFTCEGEKIVELLLLSDYKIVEILALKNYLELNQTKLAKIKTTEIGEADMTKISNLTTPQQVFAIVQIPDKNIEQKIFEGKKTVVLDNIQDPGNLGTIIRLADWFGIDSIVCSENTVEMYNPKVVQATMGSIFAVDVFYTDLKFFFEKHQQIPVVGTFINGKDIRETEKFDSFFLLMGNEANGISKDIEKCATHKISIPSYNKNRFAESLNVSTATAICLWQMLNQR